MEEKKQNENGSNTKKLSCDELKQIIVYWQRECDKLSKQLQQSNNYIEQLQTQTLFAYLTYATGIYKNRYDFDDMVDTNDEMSESFINMIRGDIVYATKLLHNMIVEPIKKSLKEKENDNSTQAE